MNDHQTSQRELPTSLLSFMETYFLHCHSNTLIIGRKSDIKFSICKIYGLHWQQKWWPESRSGGSLQVLSCRFQAVSIQLCHGLDLLSLAMQTYATGLEGRFQRDELSLLAWWSCFVTVGTVFRSDTVAFHRIPRRQDQLDPFFAFMSGQTLKRNFVDFPGGEYGPRSDARAATTWRTKPKDVLLRFIWLFGLVTKYLISLPICISKLPRVVNSKIRIPEVQRTTVNKSILCNNLPVPMLGCSNQLGLFHHFASAVWG